MLKLPFQNLIFNFGCYEKQNMNHLLCADQTTGN